MSADSPKKKVILDFLRRFPNSSQKTIAEAIYKDNPLLFRDAEFARRNIRYYLGKQGKNKSHLAVTEHKTNFSVQNPYGLPPTEAKPFEPYILPKANNNILFLTDIHLPYSDIQALTLALDYGKQHNVNTIYLNGDTLDMYQASFHEKDQKKRDLKYEFDVARQFLDVLAREFPKAKVFWKIGNHCLRWERYLRVKAPIILDMEEFRLDVILKFGERGIALIPNQQLTKIGKLCAIHGNELKGGGGINVARTLWLRASTNIIAGDKHKTQDMIETDIENKSYGSWSVGCLCELNPEYLPFNRWNLGFAHITVESNGDFQVRNLRIVNGKII